MTRARLLPATAIEVRTTSAAVLSFAPVDTIPDVERRDALAAANGTDLVLRRWTRILAAFGAVVIFAVCVSVLAGCAALDAAAPAVDTVIRGACGAILATSKPDTAAAALADGQRQLAASLAAAVDAGKADEARVIMAQLATLAADQRAGFEQLQRLAPATTVTPRCPVAAPLTP